MLCDAAHVRLGKCVVWMNIVWRFWYMYFGTSNVALFGLGFHGMFCSLLCRCPDGGSMLRKISIGSVESLEVKDWVR